MIVLRGMKDFDKERVKVQGLPMEVQAEIKQTLTILDESYGIVGERIFEGGKVIVVKEREEIEQVNHTYDLKLNEFADEIHTDDGLYLMVLVIFGSENNIMIVGKKALVESYL